MSEIPKPADALEAVDRLEVMLETIRAASIDWRLTQQSIGTLATVLSTDPAIESLVASHLNHRVDATTGVACDIGRFSEAIEAAIASLRRA